MPRQFALPDLGEGLSEAEIITVHVSEGEVVQEDAPLLEVETDKAQVEIPSPMSGRVEKVHVQPGQTVKVGAVLVTFADAVAASVTAPAAPPAKPAGGPAAAPAGVVGRAAAGGEGSGSMVGRAAAGGEGSGSMVGRAAIGGEASGSGGGPVPATPATRRLARELGVDLRALRGSGPAGRVTEIDVRAAAAGEGSGAVDVRAAAAGEGSGAVDVRAAAAPPAVARTEAVEAGGGSPPGPGKPLARVGLEPPPLPRFEQWGPIERAPLSHLRRTIAERMTLSAALVPHVTHFDRADITELDALIRKNFEPARERGVYLTLTSFLLKAAALALRAHPQFNASLDPAAGELILKRYYHLGVAMATERGLIVPVIRDVDRKPVIDLARELAALAERVRGGKASLDDLRGGTFTITNIGALGGTGALPIINYPEAAILGVARGCEEAVVRGGQIVPRLMLPLTLTFDHRVADGADGARFAADIVRRLEHPDQLLLEL